MSKQNNYLCICVMQNTIYRNYVFHRSWHESTTESRKISCNVKLIDMKLILEKWILPNLRTFILKRFLFF